MDQLRLRRIALPVRGAEDGCARSFVPAIQGLRGLAALSVMLVHIYLMPKAAGLWPAGMLDWATLILDTGGRGVELFFVISGYLIPASLRRHGSVGRFFGERMLRIMPLYVVLHLVMFVAGPLVAYKFFAGFGPHDYAASFLANLLFLAPLVDLPLAQQNAWSLTYEWLFYVWTAAVFVALGVRWNRLARACVLLPLLAGAAAIVWAFPPTGYFGVGVLFALVDVPIRFGRVTGLVLGLASLAAMYGLCEYVSVFAGLPFAAILFRLVLDTGNGFSTWLSGRVLQYLGRVSYSLYLVHPFVVFGILMAVKRLGPAEGSLWLVGPAIFVGGGIASVAAAGIAFEVVEVRLRRRLEGLFDGRRARRTHAVLDRRVDHGPEAGGVLS